jgi:hypothetical protein
MQWADSAGETVFRRNWRDREFWAWWWGNALSPRLRSGAAIASFILLGAAGAYSALKLSSANAVSPSNVTLWETTLVRSATVYTKTVRTRARRVRVVVHYVPKKPIESPTQKTAPDVKRVVTDHKVATRTVTTERTVTRLIPRRTTRTLTETVAQATPPVTVTAPPVTQTETLPAETVVVTVTVKQHGH